MVGTLLGPEASGPHARVTLVALPFGWCGVGVAGVWVCVSGCSSLCLSARLCGWGLVGLLFEICIVDASIN